MFFGEVRFIAVLMLHLVVTSVIYLQFQSRYSVRFDLEFGIFCFCASTPAARCGWRASVV